MIKMNTETYNKAYEKGTEYLIKKAEELSWTQNEIVEDSYTYDFGLTLIGYSDDEHEHEIGYVCIDLTNIGE